VQNTALSVWKPEPSCLSHARELSWYNSYQLWAPWPAACIPSLCPLYVALALDAELPFSCENMDVLAAGDLPAVNRTCAIREDIPSEDWELG